jgi:hypothetical protein
MLEGLATRHDDGMSRRFSPAYAGQPEKRGKVSMDLWAADL